MEENKKTIGILYICTGKYTIFWRDFYVSIEKYFLPDCEKKYFVFTDSLEIDFEKENKNIYRFHQEDLGWPNNTLKRFHIFLDKKNIIEQVDYLIFCNANLLIQETINSEDFLPQGNEKLFAVQHPGFFNKQRNKFTYETNKNSTACIAKNEGDIYVAGGLNGGETSSFISAMKEMKNNIEQDFKNGIVAKWHDESHWNRYIINRSDVKILDTSYLYPEGWNIPFQPRILIRDKSNYGGHAFLRKEKNSVFFRFKKIVRKFLKRQIV